MNTKTKMDVPDIGGLLGKITDKQGKGELGTTERQKVVSASEIKQNPEETGKQQNSKTNSPSIAKTFKRGNVKIGRPTVKSQDVEYVRIGAVIPKTVRQQMWDALNYEAFQMEDGQPIRTVDEIVTYALGQLLQTKTKK